MKQRKTRGLTVKKQVLDFVAGGVAKIKTQGEELWRNLRIKSTAKKAEDLMAVPVRNLKTLATRIASGPLEDFWAVDIGNRGIRLARLKKLENGNYALRDFFHQFYPVQSLDLGFPEKIQDMKVAVLEKLLQRANVVGKNVVCSISGRSVFTRARILPPIPENKIKQLVNYEIKQQIPFPLEVINVDYCVLSRDAFGCYNVLMVAVKEDVLDVFLKVFEAAGCRVHAVSANPFAVYNWLQYNGQLDSREIPVAVIDIGAETTEIVCAVGDQFRFTHPLILGFRDVSGDLNRLAEDVPEESQTDQGDNAEVKEVATPALERLAREIERSLGYFRSLPGGKKINKVVLAGDGSRLDVFAAYLKERLEIEVVIADNLAKLEVAGYNGDLLYPNWMATVLGLALSCQQDVPVDINLLPE